MDSWNIKFEALSCIRKFELLINNNNNDIVENKAKLNELPKEILEALSVMKDHDFDLDDSYMVENFTSPTEALACALLVSKGFTGSAQSYLDGTYS